MKENVLSLPFFTGFYESMHRDAIYNHIESYDYDEDKVDRKKTDLEYSKKYAEEYKKTVDEEMGGLESSIILNGFKKIISPKYYNFETDEIIVHCQYDTEKLIDYLKDNRLEFSEFIKEKNTSRDGFHSFMENSFDEYIEKIKDNIEPYQLSQVLEFELNSAGYDDIDNDIYGELVGNDMEIILND